MDWLDGHMADHISLRRYYIEGSPAGPGLYAFTVEDDRELRVAYVGLTSHLWMVTKGRLPGGQEARGGHRYGRPGTPAPPASASTS
jgi:hypothetical protein